MTDKWRPSLALVIGGMLTTMLVLPPAGYLLARLNDGQGMPRWDTLSAGALAAAAAVVTATIIIAFVSMRAIARPIRELRLRTARIAAGDRDWMRPLDHNGTRDTAELAAAFLDMAGQLQRRSEVVRTFATHVSHELKSPLTSIKGAAELLRDAGETMDAATLARFHANILADAERMSALVRRLIELVRAENSVGAGEGGTPGEAIRRVAGPEGLIVALNGEDMRTAMPADDLGVVLSHLADNAAAHGATRLTVRVERRGERVAVTASDDGQGVAPGHRDKVFEPFYTTRRDSGGTGLGLSIVAALLAAHGASIRLTDSERGARFEIDLPAA